jgi:dipeptidyl aminopeptidase/acylaminoacyl peptidase
VTEDPRVASAIAHWGPRYVTNGVPIGDFTDVTGDLDSWDDWCSAWSARGDVHRALGDDALAAGHTRTAGELLRTAALCYHFAKFLFVQDLDQLRAAHRKAVAAHRAALPHLDPPGERVEVPYLEGTTLKGNLRRPAGVDRPPVVVMVFGLDSAKEEGGTYEDSFLARGLATFAFDGPGQGESEFEHPLRHDFEVPVGAVIDHLTARRDIDPERIGLWGVSLGGHLAVRAAAFDARVRACVSLSGSYRVADTWQQRPELNRRAYEVRSHARTPQEAAEHVARFDLEGVAERVSCPLYVVGGTEDRLVSPDAAERIAREASGPVVLDLIDGGNHVVNNKPYAYRPQTADWLAAQLDAGR